MNIREIIGININQCIKESKMDYKDYAKLIKVTRQTVGNYINGTSIIDSEKLYTTSIYFNIPLDWFYEIDHNVERYTKQDICNLEIENRRMKAQLIHFSTSIKEITDKMERY